MEKTTIGIARVTYDEMGRVDSANFTPTIKVDLFIDTELAKQLISVPGDSQDEFKQNADLILGAWFVKMDAKLSEIETADRDRYEVASDVVECEKYPNGSVKSCALEYYFQERSALLN